MNKFLDKLRRYTDATVTAGPYKGEYDCNFEAKKESLNMIDSLGENARRMLEIGIIQDKLVELGFELFNHNGYGADIDKMRLFGTARYKMRLFGTARFEIVFHPTSVFLYHIPSLNEKQVKDTKLDISYNSTTWQEDLINRVKELIK